MGSILIIELWKHRWPALSALGTMLVVFFWPSIPLKGVGNWLQFFYYYTPQNFLYALLTLLAGLYVGIYVYNKTVCTTCRVGTEKTGTAGLLGGVLLGACPACIPVLAVFLPLGVSVYLSRISWVFLILSIALITFLMYRMNGFKKA
ncbi:MAG TPA: hypothetical protein VGA53_01050 [Candidatus Paceibacterota bacterium]